MTCFRCFSPKFIKNRKGEIIEVPCGKCDACNNRKNERLRTLCDLETQCHTYCYFVTLTYAPDYLPLAYPHKNGKYYSFVNTTSRLDSYYPGVIGIHSIDELPFFKSEMFFSKFDLPNRCRGFIPYLAPVDVQLFMKRLRKNLLKYSNEKIRYVAVGEYGPKHFRPHYHLLLWFDSPLVQKNIRKTVCTSWKFGRVDCQKSFSTSSSYVTKYVNSNSVLSRLHSLKCFRPFALHSIRIGEQFYSHEIEKVYEIPVNSLIERRFPRNGRIKQLPPILSFENGFFPKCYNFGSLSMHERELCYTLYSRAQQEFGSEKVSELSEVIYNYLYHCCYRDDRRMLSCSPYAPKTIQVFCRLIGSENFTDLTPLSILYTSKKFLKLKDTYGLSVSYLIRCIDDYWSSKDYLALCNQLRSQQELLSKHGSELRYNLLWFYSNFKLITANQLGTYRDEWYYIKYRRDMGFPPTPSDLLKLDLIRPEYPKPVKDYIYSLGYQVEFFNEIFFDLNDNPEYNEFVSFNKKIARDSIKHKSLNDANKLFNY